MAYMPHTWVTKEKITATRLNNIEQGLKSASENTGIVGPQGPKGETGATGPQGLKGDPGEGVPTGGAAGQILAKKSSTNYDTQWIDPPKEIAPGLTEAEVDSKISTAINGLIDGAPQAYDTLKEISDYIAEDKNAADAMNLSIANKVDKTTTVNGKALNGNINLTADDVNAVNKQYVDNAIASISAVTSDLVSNIVVMTQAEYDALTTKNATTLYLIKD